MFTVEDFDYRLPEELIAQQPSATRSASRLLCVHGRQLADRQFSELPELLSPNDLLVFNDTRVIKARLLGRKASGGKIELLVERIVGPHQVLAHLRASKPPSAGTALVLEDTVQATVEGRAGELYRVRFDDAVEHVLERHGRVPLPPYIEHAAGAEDESRYQTVYAREPGAVAAPTAGLHFDEPLLGRLRERGVRFAWLTLHVGAGTFQPVRASRLEDHTMHSERYSIPQQTARAVSETKAAGAKVIAVGTTSVRALESAAAFSGDSLAGSGETRLFITPGYRFRVVDRLITNFHLPRSTLLMLVCAFGGMRELLAAYDHAVRARYRFFSYGDAMLLDRAPQ